MNAGFWHEVPIVRLFIPFAIGVGISMFAPLPFLVTFSVTVILTVLLFVLHSIRLSFRFRIWYAIIANACMLCAGMSLHQWQDVRFATSYFAKQTHSYIILEASQPPTAKKKSWKVVCKVRGVLDSSLTKKMASGRIVVYLEKTDSIPPIAYGDVYIIPSALVSEVKPPQNPGEFNYKRYLAFHHTHHQVYLREHNFVKTGMRNGHFIFNFVYATQAYFNEVLIRYIRSKNEMGVAQALLYGYDDGIDAETVQAYANTGTLHVLAVSGMHVGIIFMILNLFLKRLDRKKNTRIFKAVIVLAVLWTYSLLCGLSPSILRATVMFSFIVLAQTAERKSNIYNILAASAFVLMCFDTNIIANVGFQLSYMAVLGIVFIQPYIYRWYTAQSWLGDQIWKIVTVSVAAQISTSPIGILYFHQFPNVFLFSNLCIIPLTTVILYGCLLLMAISPIHLLATLIGWILYGIITFTNILVKWVEKIPYAYIEGIQIDIPQTLMLYGIFGLLIGYLLRYEMLLLKAAMGCILVFTIIESMSEINSLKRKEITVFNINRHTAVRVINGKESFMIADSALYVDADKKRFHLQQHYWNSRIKKENFMSYNNENKYLEFGPVKLLLLSKACEYPLDTVDLVIIDQPFHHKHLSLPAARMYIIGNKLSEQQVAQYQDYFYAQNLPAYNLRESGAFQLSL